MELEPRQIAKFPTTTKFLILDDPSAPSVSSNQKNALHGDASEKDIEIVEEVENTAGRTETIPEQALVKFSGLEGGEVIPVIDLEEPELEVIENQESATPIGNAGVERTSNDDEDDFCVVENTGKTNSIDNKEFVAENAMKFLKWFYRVPTADYYNHLVYSRPNYLTKSIVPDEYALDVEAAKRLLHEYLTVFNSRIKILIDFYDEYAEEVIRVMLILAAVLENGNKRIDWTILCREYLNNRMLKKARKFFEKPTVFSDPPAKNGPKELLEHLLVLTPEAILATTVVFFEAKGWCEKKSSFILLPK
ncbi:unnamed protein product [Caenorhabditis auriculariae]|uniref:Uncharacterized protein n=1 Tax=Caenorhabditis auriculariae TaxID=2777116 RepID=A0A8S1GQ02_9PELO|nr:unnamed protein product [Caenorhabditis auriculariae]